METVFYEESSLLAGNSKGSKSYEGNSMWLNLCPDTKLLEAARRDELALSDLADFLRSPDLGISSPDLESLVWKEWNDTMKPASPANPPEKFIISKQEENSDLITKEQEVFAFGFTEALKKLKEEEQDLQGAETTEENDDTTSECSTEETTQSAFEDTNTRITFISYVFNSAEPLPSFQEAFLKTKLCYRRNQELSHQIKSGQGEFEVPRIPAVRDVSVSSSHGSVEAEETLYWEKVETVDEGFCGRENTGMSYATHDANTSISPVLSLQRENEIFSEEAAHNRNFTPDKSSTRDLSEIIPKDFDNEDLIGDSEIADEDFAHKQWLALHSKLYHIDASLHESRIANSGYTADVMLVDGHFQDRFKAERKKRNNRFSALKTKTTKDSNLSTVAGGLCLENVKLIEELEIIRKRKESLAMPFIDATSGYPDVTHAQYTEI